MAGLSKGSLSWVDGRLMISLFHFRQPFCNKTLAPSVQGRVFEVSWFGKLTRHDFMNESWGRWLFKRIGCLCVWRYPVIARVSEALWLTQPQMVLGCRETETVFLPLFSPEYLTSFRRHANRNAMGFQTKFRLATLPWQFGVASKIHFHF